MKSKQDELLLFLPVVEIVEIQGPDHATTVSVLLDHLGLAPDLVDIVVAHPLVALPGNRANGVGRVLPLLPSLILQSVANLERISRKIIIFFIKGLSEQNVRGLKSS